MTHELVKSISYVKNHEPEDQKLRSNGIEQLLLIRKDFRVINDEENSIVTEVNSSVVEKLDTHVTNGIEHSTVNEVHEIEIDETNKSVTDETQNFIVSDAQESVVEETNKSVIDEPRNFEVDGTNQVITQETESFLENEAQELVVEETSKYEVDEPQSSTMNEVQGVVVDEAKEFVADEPQSSTINEVEEFSVDETNKFVTEETENFLENEAQELVVEETSKYEVDEPQSSTINEVEEFSVDETNKFVTEETENFLENEVQELVVEETTKPVTATTEKFVPNQTQELTDEYWTNMSTSHQRTFAPLNVPLYRRRQTLTILVWLLMPWFCLYLSFVLLRCDNWYIVGAFVAYLTWMFVFQKYSRTGGLKQQWLRRLEWWKWFADYFPIHLHKTCDLPADRPYIFGCHPHGIISLGAFCNFATEATGFEEKFPGINLRLLTLKVNFRIPFYGLYLSMMGVCDASKESCNYILEKGNGNSILLVLGGAKESLDAHPSKEYILTLKNRKGFVKIGLANGASLVPVFSFGENDLYDQLANPRGSRLRRIQMKIQKRLGYATPFFKGRGIFQYAVGFLPNRHPIDTYVGEPIHLPKLERDKITPDIVDKYHQEYMEALKRLFDTYKEKHGSADATIKYVDDNEW